MTRAPIVPEAVAFIATLQRRPAPASCDSDGYIPYADFDDLSSDATEAQDGVTLGDCLICRGVTWARSSPRSLCCQDHLLSLSYRVMSVDRQTGRTP